MRGALGLDPFDNAAADRSMVLTKLCCCLLAADNTAPVAVDGIVPHALLDDARRNFLDERRVCFAGA